MKRHIAQIYKILEYVEQKGNGEWLPALECSSYETHVVHYHIELCKQAGYFNTKKIPGREERYPRYKIGRLTWQVHEMLKECRNEK